MIWTRNNRKEVFQAYKSFVRSIGLPTTIKLSNVKNSDPFYWVHSDLDVYSVWSCIVRQYIETRNALIEAKKHEIVYNIYANKSCLEKVSEPYSDAEKCVFAEECNKHFNTPCLLNNNEPCEIKMIIEKDTNIRFDMDFIDLGQYSKELK